jgi:LemA protein
MTTGLIITLVVVAVIAMFAVGQYNKLVSLRNRFRNSFAQIDVQLKRRYDLIPNLIEVAKGYMKHERETLEAVIQARNQAATAEKRAAADPTDANAVGELMAAERTLTGRSAASSHYPKPIRTSRPTRT